MKYAFAAALLVPALAGANDGIAGVSAGGIVFRHTDAIAMKKEVLNVSRKLISVDYDFVNESATDLEETIAFPLPAYPAAQQGSDTYYGQPADFSITVDGAPVPFLTVVQAKSQGADFTAQLKNIGLSDAQIAYNRSFGSKAEVAPFSARQRQQLNAFGLLAEDASGQIAPVWDVHVSYVWQQKFPSKKIVHVHHAYRPFVATGPAEWTMDKGTAQFYCADASFLKTWKRLALEAGSSDGSMLNAAKVSYILKTGNTWKNGIEDFTLNIIKSKPTELVSLCFPGTFRKTGLTSYQVYLNNFKPDGDLQVYFGNVDFDEYDGQMPAIRK